MNIGLKIYKLCTTLFPLHRSLMGKNNFKTLKIIQNKIPQLRIKHFSSKDKCFDWKIPNEWVIQEAYISDLDGNKIIDYKNNNLHVVQYSQRKIINEISINDLDQHLHYIKSKPDTIPYVTSYYTKNWGFCLTYNQYLKLKKNKKVKIVINSKFIKGKMHYGELILKGKSKRELLLTTYICHPNLANNEVSGPSLLTYITKYLLRIDRNYTYRILFIPETVGTICYIKNNISKLKLNVVGGLVVTCVGIENIVSYIKTKNKDSIINKIIERISKDSKITYKIYPYHKKGSDERQYNSPNIGIDVGSLMSAKYNEYKQYHTSDDNLDLISPKGLSNMYYQYVKFIKEFESIIFYKSTIYCEPFMSKRSLYPKLSKNYKSPGYKQSKKILNVLDYCDGKTDLKQISEILNLEIREIEKVILLLLKYKMIKKIS